MIKTRITFAIAPKDENKAVTKYFIDLFFDTNLNGLNPRITLKALIEVNDKYEVKLSKSEMKRIRKSKVFQESLKYAFSPSITPKDTTFTTNSIKYAIVNPASKIP